MTIPPKNIGNSTRCFRDVRNHYQTTNSVEVANEKNSGTKGLAAVVVTKNNESLTIGKTSGLGRPISNHKGMENASMANVATKVGKNIEISKLLDTISPKIYQKDKLSGHEFLYELSKAFSQEQDKTEFIILNITILTAIYNQQKEMK